ncbi:MAG TPA: class I SAM-dependent methyltransferase [Candidatus Sulfotelmatobacter sp.]|nr:class I SAM-dependent methyltransferase [Candidatus Sulfotelmatobacter sp.]
MAARLTQTEVYEYWNQQASEYGQSPSASWSDIRVIEMEIAEITKHLSDGDRVLDAGCANGFSSVEFACARRVMLRGVDYVPRMIEQARDRLDSVRDKLVGSVEFGVGDITELAEPSNAYDKVIVVRVLINLGTWERQLRGLHECIRVLKPGGLLLLSEATLQGWRRLNSLRSEWGLDDIPMPSFNQYVDQDQVIAAVTGEAELVELSNFASTYYVGTRLLKPLLALATNAPISVADPNAEWNRWFSQLPAAGDFGTQKLFVFRKL